MYARNVFIEVYTAVYMVMSWILLAAIVLFVFLILKSKEVRHKAGAIVTILAVLFLVLTFSQVAMQPGVDFGSFDGLISAGKIYFTWLGQVFGNLGKISGNAVHLDWGLGLSKNSTLGAR